MAWRLTQAIILYKDGFDGWRISASLGIQLFFDHRNS